MPKTAPRPYMDFNRTATNDKEAVMMILDLYSYIDELENYIDYLKGE